MRIISLYSALYSLLFFNFVLSIICQYCNWASYSFYFNEVHQVNDNMYSILKYNEYLQCFLKKALLDKTKYMVNIINSKGCEDRESIVVHVRVWSQNVVSLSECLHETQHLLPVSIHMHSLGLSFARAEPVYSDIKYNATFACHTRACTWFIFACKTWSMFLRNPGSIGMQNLDEDQRERALRMLVAVPSQREFPDSLMAMHQPSKETGRVIYCSTLHNTLHNILHITLHNTQYTT